MQRIHVTFGSKPKTEAFPCPSQDYRRGDSLARLKIKFISSRGDRRKD